MLMKTKIIILLQLLFLLGCDRKISEDEVIAHRDHDLKSTTVTEESGQKNATGSADVEADKQGDKKTRDDVEHQADSKALKLIGDKLENGELSDQSLKQLIELIPKLKSDVFFAIVANIHPRQAQPFVERIVNELKALSPIASKNENSELRRAYHAIASICDSEVGKVALAQFYVAPPYVFPKDRDFNPFGWPSLPDTEHMEHGLQCMLAKAVVENADEQTIANYREALKSAKTDMQRVMIWALGSSERIEDFDLLMSLRPKIKDEDTLDTLTRSLNKILESRNAVQGHLGRLVQSVARTTFKSSGRLPFVLKTSLKNKS